jgi:hypothetical protein
MVTKIAIGRGFDSHRVHFKIFSFHKIIEMKYINPKTKTKLNIYKFQHKYQFLDKKIRPILIYQFII